MLFIFDMGGVVTKPDEMPDFFNWLNLTPQEFFTLCTGSSSNIWNAFESGKLSIDDFWSAFLKQRAYAQKTLSSRMTARKTALPLHPWAFTPSALPTRTRFVHHGSNFFD